MGPQVLKLKTSNRQNLFFKKSENYVIIVLFIELNIL